MARFLCMLALILTLAIPAQARLMGPDSIADLVERVSPAVVNLDTVSRQKNPLSELDPFFHRFFSNEIPRLPRYFEQRGVGSGFLISSDGLIVTNYHVIKGAGKIKVTLPSGTTYEGKVIGRDSPSDIALVKIEAGGLPTLSFADPAKIRVGDWVVAIGSPLGLKTTVTAGIVSALNRDVQIKEGVAFIQTDAPINPGNSGGPLLNMDGEVIGMNTMIAANAQGIGFSIPVSTIKEVIGNLQANGKIERPWLGVTLGATPVGSDNGILVRDVAHDGPAEKAGLSGGDLILEVDGKKPEDPRSLLRYVASRKVGATIHLLVSRSGQKKQLYVRLEAIPETMGGE